MYQQIEMAAALEMILPENFEGHSYDICYDTILVFICTDYKNLIHDRELRPC
jgi:hypothetical protein